MVYQSHQKFHVKLHIKTMNLKNYFQGKTYMFLTIIKSRGATMSQSRKVMSQQYHLPLMLSLQCFVERIVAIM